MTTIITESLKSMSKLCPAMPHFLLSCFEQYIHFIGAQKYITNLAKKYLI